MKAFLFFILVIFLPLLLSSQQRWEVVFGNPDIIDPPVSSVNSYDGGVLLCGHNELHQGTMYKTDKNGIVLWSAIFEGDNPTPASIGEDSYGNKVIVGACTQMHG